MRGDYGSMGCNLGKSSGAERWVFICLIVAVCLVTVVSGLWSAFADEPVIRQTGAPQDTEEETGGCPVSIEVNVYEEDGSLYYWVKTAEGCGETVFEISFTYCVSIGGVFSVTHRIYGDIEDSFLIDSADLKLLTIVGNAVDEERHQSVDYDVWVSPSHTESLLNIAVNVWHMKFSVFYSADITKDTSPARFSISITTVLKGGGIATYSSPIHRDWPHVPTDNYVDLALSSIVGEAIDQQGHHKLDHDMWKE